MSIRAFQSYHFIHEWPQGSLRTLLNFTKLFLLSQFLLMLRGVEVKGQTGTPIPLMGDDIQEIVEAHNFFRSIVEPPASNMQRIVSFSIKELVQRRFILLLKLKDNELSIIY